MPSRDECEWERNSAHSTLLTTATYLRLPQSPSSTSFQLHLIQATKGTTVTLLRALTPVAWSTSWSGIWVCLRGDERNRLAPTFSVVVQLLSSLGNRGEINWCRLNCCAIRYQRILGSQLARRCTDGSCIEHRNAGSIVGNGLLKEF